MSSFHDMQYGYLLTIKLLNQFYTSIHAQIGKKKLILRKGGSPVSLNAKYANLKIKKLQEIVIWEKSW